MMTCMTDLVLSNCESDSTLERSTGLRKSVGRSSVLSRDRLIEKKATFLYATGMIEYHPCGDMSLKYVTA